MISRNHLLIYLYLMQIYLKHLKHFDDSKYINQSISSPKATTDEKFQSPTLRMYKDSVCEPFITNYKLCKK